MDFKFLDVVVNTFVAALQSGAATLGKYSLGLLAVLGAIAFRRELWPVIVSGGSQIGDALGTFLFFLVRTGFFMWILVNLIPLTDAVFSTFLTWGGAVGGAEAAARMTTPSSVATIGFVISEPLDKFIQGHSGWATLWNAPQLMMYGLINFAILSTFPFVAVALLLVKIEFYMAVMAGDVLIPWGILAHTAFVSEFVIGWIVGGAIRAFLISAIVGLGFPLFAATNLAVGPAGNPTILGAVSMFVAVILFVALAFIVPNKTSHLAGRLVLGLTGSQVASVAVGWGRFAMGSASALRGVSNMVRARPVPRKESSMSEALPTTVASNGHVILPPALEEYPALLLGVMEQTRCTLDARDTSAEQRAWMWHRCTLWLGAVLAVAVLVIAWLVYERRDVQAFVQVVQMDGERLVQIGVPQKLLDYTPAEGAWHDLMAEWLTRLYWRGEDVHKAEKLRLALGRVAYLPQCATLSRWPERPTQARQKIADAGPSERTDDYQNAHALLLPGALGNRLDRPGIPDGQDGVIHYHLHGGSDRTQDAGGCRSESPRRVHRIV